MLKHQNKIDQLLAQVHFKKNDAQSIFAYCKAEWDLELQFSYPNEYVAFRETFNNTSDPPIIQDREVIAHASNLIELDQLMQNLCEGNVNWFEILRKEGVKVAFFANGAVAKKADCSK